MTQNSVREGPKSSVLGFAEATTSWIEHGMWKSTIKKVTFLDLTVDGRPLRELLPTPDLSEPTPLRSGFEASFGREWLDHLRNPVGGELRDGYALVYVCEICGDLGDPFLSMRIDRYGDEVQWSDFGWSSASEERAADLDPSPTFHFAAAQYDAVLAELVTRWEAAVRTEPATGRLWWKVPETSSMEF